MTDGGRRWALVATSLGFAVVQLDVSVVNVAIKPIGAELGGGVNTLQWVVNAYTVAFASLILSAGALGDRIGAKRVFVAGFVLFTSASVGCAVAATTGQLIGARTAQGVGAAMLVPCSLALLNHAYRDAHARARAVGLWAAGASVALSAGPLVGGLLIASLGWRSIFLINVPIGLLGILLTWKFAAETTRSPNRGVDVAGQVVAIVGLTALATALVEGGQRGFGDPWVLVGFGLALAAAAGFLAIESRGTQPMLPLGLFGSSTFSAATAIGLLINVVFYGLIFVFSLYFQNALHYSALETGLAFGPATVAVLVANLGAGRLTRRVGSRAVLIAGAILMAAGALGLLAVVDAGTSYAAVVGQLVALGAGIGLIVPAMTSALLGSVDTSQSGVASGTLNTARQTGSVVGVALFGSLAAVDLVGGLRVALIVSLGLVVAAAVASLPVRTPS